MTLNKAALWATIFAAVWVVFAEWDSAISNIQRFWLFAGPYVAATVAVVVVIALAALIRGFKKLETR